MAYYHIPGKSTVVEALGQVDNGRYRKGETEIYYMSFAGPQEACKAIWAWAVGSRKTGKVETNYWRSGSLAKPNKRSVCRLKTSNYMHYIMRLDNPGFILVVEPMLNKIGPYVGGQIHPSRSDAAARRYVELKKLLPDWEPDSIEDHGYQVTTWLQRRDCVKAELARKLVNALNESTKVPVLPEWGPALVRNLPQEAKMDLDLHGDALVAIMLNPTFRWHEWIGELLRTGKIEIPTPLN